MAWNKIVKATVDSLLKIDQKRFYGSERGYHGRFYCCLNEELEEAGVLDNDVILEMEYQKSARHDMYQRPDIILHVPAEVYGAPVNVNNYAVWALKLHATDADAIADFGKLDQMIEKLNYPIAIFINIRSSDSKLHLYTGNNRSRMFAFAVRVEDGHPKVSISYFKNGKLFERQIG